MKNSNHHKKNKKNMMKKLNKKNTMKKLTPDLICTMRSCSNLSTILEMVCVFFTVCGKKEKQVTCQLKKGDAYIVHCKTHINKNSTKCRHDSVNYALHCYRHILIANNSLQLQGFQAPVILYILPGNEELQPPRKKTRRTQ